MKTSRKISLILIICSLLGSVFAYYYLPPLVNLRLNGGTSGGGVSKNYILLISLIPALVYYSTLITALFDKKSGTQDNRKFLDIIAMASLFTALVANWGIILIAYNFSIDIDLVTKALFGVLFILIGNYLGQLDINSVMGVRNKWTLSGMGVWKPVHRFSGYIMFISGIMLMLSAFVKAANGIAVVVLLLLIDFIVINIYSYNKYKKVVKKA